MPGMFLLSHLPRWCRTTTLRYGAFLLRVVGELGFHYIVVERALIAGSTRSNWSRARSDRRRGQYCSP